MSVSAFAQPTDRDLSEPSAEPTPAATAKSPVVAPKPTLEPESASVPETSLEHEAIPNSQSAESASRTASSNPNWANPGWSPSTATTIGNLVSENGVKTIVAGSSLNLSISASDYDTNPSGASVADTLYFHWKTTGGSLNRTGRGTSDDAGGANAIFTAPQQPGKYTIAVIVNDTGYRSYTQTGRNSDIIGGHVKEDNRNDSWEERTLEIKVIPRVARIEYLHKGEWYNWTQVHSLLKGRRIRFKAIPSWGPWPTGYPRWNASEGVNLTRHSDGTCTAEYTAVSNSTRAEDYKNVNGYALTSSVAVRAIVGRTGLYSVTFSGDQPVFPDTATSSLSVTDWEFNGWPLHEAYSAPHYTSAALPGEAQPRKFPISYAGRQKMKVSASFWVEPEGFTGTVRMRARSQSSTSGGVTYTFAGQDLNAIGVYPAIEAATAFDFSALKYPSMKLDWQISLNDTWSTVGTSENKVYRTLNPSGISPNSMTVNVSGTPIQLSRSQLFETVVDMGLRAGRKATSAGVADSVWKDIAIQRNQSWPIVQKVRGGAPDGMRYWGNQGLVLPAFWSSWLMQYSDGRCGAWQNFMMDALKAHGAVRAYYPVTILPPKPSYPYVLDNNGKAIGEDYFHNTTENYKFYNELEVYSRLTAQGGHPGQNAFTNHAVVKNGSTVFDPSYGVKRTSQADWERQAIKAFFWLKVEKVNGVETTEKVNYRYNTNNAQETIWRGETP